MFIQNSRKFVEVGFLFILCVGPDYWIQVVRHGSKVHLPLSHLTSLDRSDLAKVLASEHCSSETRPHRHFVSSIPSSILSFPTFDVKEEALWKCHVWLSVPDHLPTLICR